MLKTLIVKRVGEKNNKNMNVWRIGSNWGKLPNLAPIFKEYNIAFAGQEIQDKLNSIRRNDIVAITDGQKFIAVGTVDEIVPLKDIKNELANDFSDVKCIKFKKCFWKDDLNFDMGIYGGQGKQFNQAQNEYPNLIKNIFTKAENFFFMQNIQQILQSKKQIILQGAPGTGKTFATAEISLRMIGKEIPSDRKKVMEAYQEAVKTGQIVFTTFHQSMDYEEFIEGLKPVKNQEGELSYDVQSGIFKDICDRATVKDANSFDKAYQKMLENIGEQEDEMLILATERKKEFGLKINSNNNLTLYTGNREKSMGTFTKNSIMLAANGNIPTQGWEGYYKKVVEYLQENCAFNAEATEVKNYVLIIDEINRGNISKIFGELITLLEADKRVGETNEIKVRLPYSKSEFGVPSNVYIIGTMNTTDRSLGFIDYAVRRRFAFHTLCADKNVITNDKAKQLFEKIEKLIQDNLNKIDFNFDDIMIGHSYFLTDKDDDLQLKLDYEIKPLLREYVKDGILNFDENILSNINDLTI